MSSPRTYSCALITGASSGLGEEYARQLAGRVDKLILVARRESHLTALAESIRNEFPRVAVATYPADLSQAIERQQLIEAVHRSGFVPDLLINNAGLGDYGEFSTSDWEKIEAILHVNIEALTHLTHAFVPEMIHRGGGAIMQVSSIASLVPIPDLAVYAASKAYVTSFSEALRIELLDYNIPVLAVCPGPVHTGFGKAAQRTSAASEMSAREFFYVPKEQVVAESISALDRQAARVYPGWKTAALAMVLAAMPIVLARLVMERRPRR